MKRFESKFYFNFALNTRKHYFSTYCGYLSKMRRMDEGQAISEQLTLNDFKKWSSIAFKTFNNSTIINNDQQ